MKSYPYIIRWLFPKLKDMKKIVMIMLMALMMPVVSNAQNDAAKKLTKFEQITSKTGRIFKFVDVRMPSIPKNLFGSVSTGIRTAMGEQFNSYFYRIEDPETNRSVAHIAMIEYSDLVEINKALAKLAAEADTDCSANPDYLENRFVTNDGFEIGYYVSKGKASWYMKLERYSSSTVFVKNAESLTTNFQDAQKKIEELKAVYKK